MKLGEISEIDYGTRIVKKSEEGTIYPVYGGGGETFRANSFNREDCFVISRFGMSPECIRFIKGEFFLNDSGMTLNTKQKNMLKIEYLNYYLFLNQERVYLCGRGVAQKNIDIEAFNSLQIPLPPINIQEKIVAEIEVLEKKEEKAKKEAEGLREGIEELFKKEIFNKFSKIKIGELAETSSGGTPLRSNFQYYENPTIPWLTSSEVRQGNIYKSESFISELGLKESSAKLFPINSVLLAMYGATAGQVGILRFEASTNQAICGILPNERYLPEFMFYHLKFQYEDLLKARTGVARDNLSQDKIKEFEIFIPPIEEQREIVSKIEKLEEKINQLEKGISLIPSLKEAVLEKYL